MQHLSAVSKVTERPLSVSKTNQSTLLQNKSMHQPLMPNKLDLNGSVKTYKTFQNYTQKRRPSHHRVWNAKVESQEKAGVTNKFDLEGQNEAGQRLSVAEKTHWS